MLKYCGSYVSHDVHFRVFSGDHGVIYLDIAPCIEFMHRVYCDFKDVDGIQWDDYFDTVSMVANCGSERIVVVPHDGFVEAMSSMKKRRDELESR